MKLSDKVRSVSLSLSFIALSGCAVAFGEHRLLPPAEYLNPTPRDASEVRIYQPHTRPAHGCLRLAVVTAHGNGYADSEALEEALLDEAAQVSADYVLTQDIVVTGDETVGMYAWGMLISSQIERPHLNGIACRNPQVEIGLHFKDQLQGWLIRYVVPKSPADEAGFKEGETLLTVNGVFVPDNPYLFDREIGSARPGDTLAFEVLNKQGDKITQNVKAPGCQGRYSD